MQLESFSRIDWWLENRSAFAGQVRYRAAVQIEQSEGACPSESHVPLDRQQDKVPSAYLCYGSYGTEAPGD